MSDLKIGQILHYRDMIELNGLTGAIVQLKKATVLAGCKKLENFIVGERIFHHMGSIRYIKRKETGGNYTVHTNDVYEIVQLPRKKKGE